MVWFDHALSALHADRCERRLQSRQPGTWLEQSVCRCGHIQVSPGNQIPAIPRHRVKLGIDYAVTDAWKIGRNALFVSSQYLVGDNSTSMRSCRSTLCSISTPPIS